MKYLVCILQFLTVFVFIQARNINEPRVLGGEVAQKGQYPWMVFINASVAGQQNSSKTCGGSLIDEEWVLTSTQCVKDKNSFSIGVGDTGVNSLKYYQVEKVLLYNADITNFENDISLIKIKEKVKLNDNVKVIQLPSKVQQSETMNGVMANFTGYGSIGHLQKLKMKIISNAECADMHSTIKDSQMCAIASTNEGPCTGDEGSPLVIQDSDGKYTQVGIFSVPSQNCMHKGVYVRVSKYLEWINKQTKIPIRNNSYMSHPIAAIVFFSVIFHRMF